MYSGVEWLYKIRYWNVSLEPHTFDDGMQCVKMLLVDIRYFLSVIRAKLIDQLLIMHYQKSFALHRNIVILGEATLLSVMWKTSV
jgi:hypothetical protein